MLSLPSYAVLRTPCCNIPLGSLIPRVPSAVFVWRTSNSLLALHSVSLLSLSDSSALLGCTRFQSMAPASSGHRSRFVHFHYCCHYRCHHSVVSLGFHYSLLFLLYFLRLLLWYHFPSLPRSLHLRFLGFQLVEVWKDQGQWDIFCI